MDFTAALCVLFPALLAALDIQRAKEGSCLLPVDEGPCRGLLQRFYYNTLRQRCEPFDYGGCEGNGNNFKSFELCQKACWRIPKVPKICRMPMEEGPCRGYLRRFFFNMTSRRCEEFFYGGCEGNNNRFMELGACQDYCQPQKSIPGICLGPLDTGSCSASIPRYYYNTVTKTCEEFLYTGCGGNNNNFVSKEGCTDMCTQGKRAAGVMENAQKIRIKKKNSNLLKV